MAEELDTPSFGSFSIEDTAELGSGNTSPLDELFSSESVSTSPEKIEKIEPKKKVEKATPEKEKPKKEEKKPLDSLFEEEEEEEKEEGDEKPEDKKKVEKKAENEGEEEEEEEEGAEKKNNFNALATDLFNLGVFTKEEGEEDVEINTPQELLDRFNAEKQKGAYQAIERFIGQFGEDYQQAFDAIYVKGANPKEYFGIYNNIKDFSSLDLKTEANQIAVIKQTLAAQDLSPEDIDAEVERLKNYGDLETVAQRYHKVLVKKEAEKLTQLEKDSAAKIEQQAAIKRQYVTNVNTILQKKIQAKEFDGIPVNPKLAQELQDFLITDKYKTPSGETLTEFDRTILDLKRPENHEKKVKVALLLKILEKDPTLSTIQKAGLTKKADTLFSEVARQTGKSSVKTEKTTKPSSWFIN